MKRVNGGTVEIDLQAISNGLGEACRKYRGMYVMVGISEDGEFTTKQADGCPTETTALFMATAMATMMASMVSQRVFNSPKAVIDFAIQAAHAVLDCMGPGPDDASWRDVLEAETTGFEDVDDEMVSEMLRMLTKEGGLEA